jgi:DNA-binding response OmpR family regulator
MTPCPCCGAPVDAADLKTVRETIRWTDTEQRVVDAFTRWPGRRFSRSALADLVYAEHKDGGPDWAINAMSVYVNRVRKKLRPTGWTIASRSGPGGCYWIARA